MLSWLTGAGADAAGRLVAQVVVTAVLARFLAAEEFGVAALVLSTATVVATIAGGAPFEEALVYQRRVNRGHFQTALAASFALATAFTVLAWVGGPWLAQALSAPGLALPLLASCVTLFAGAEIVVLTAFARRRRRFNAVARSSLIGAIVGGLASIVFAVMDGGVWAIVGGRIVWVCTQAAVLSVQLRVAILPVWRWRRLQDLMGFAQITSLERLTENAHYFVFNYVVGAVFGVAAVGTLNLAMRVVEPLRGAFMTISHNLAYPSLAAAARDPLDLRRQINDTAVAQTLIALPMFLGVAAISPSLIPVVAGPGWEEAVVIAMCLAGGGAVMASVQALYTATQVIGRPSLNLVRRLLGLASMLATLLGAAALGPAAAGLGRLIGDATEAAWSATIAARTLNYPVVDLLKAVGRLWICGLVMAASVFGLEVVVAPQAGAFAALVLGVAAGVVAYAGAVWLLARRHALMVHQWLRPALPSTVSTRA